MAIYLQCFFPIVGSSVATLIFLFFMSNSVAIFLFVHDSLKNSQLFVKSPFMSIGCDTGIPAYVVILLLQQFVSFCELYLLHIFLVFVMFPLDYCHVTSDTC